MKNIEIKVLTVCLFINCVTPKIIDTSDALKSRQKRFLLFEEGINWIQMVVGIGFPVELRQETVTWGATVKSFYLLPTNSSEFLNPTIDITERSIPISRWKVYAAIKDFVNRFKAESGKSCLLRAICEAALAPLEEKSGLFAELLHILLTPSATDERVEHHTDWEYHAAEKLGKENSDCKILFPHCDFYLLEHFSKIFS